MRQGVAIVAFTERGCTLGRRLAERLDGVFVSGREAGFSLAEWTRMQFETREALIFVGAAGIAVRAIAPWIRGKAIDPAVLCVDEQGDYAIPLLSGHLGGANALARQVAALTGGTAVLTTATDLNGQFAVDLWAKKQNLAVLQPEWIKSVSARILDGETVTVQCPWPIAGERPAQVLLGESGDVVVDLRPLEGAALQLVPRVACLGIGCRRGVSREQLEEVFARFCEERRILPQTIVRAASIDRKADEEGLLAFCAAHGWPIRFYTAEELAAAEGEFRASHFVEDTVGVDNVCERAAALAGGPIQVERKYAENGVTFALAMARPAWDWSW